ncbi:hypothetical protein VTJ49DRAFT_3799 [Mycothermus thermophilus]|uniref:MRG domain-containing protein n=1 Tax=Humicola insolens TaxID=85995 RepID=A0ABR3V758_HUMIN
MPPIRNTSTSGKANSSPSKSKRIGTAAAAGMFTRSKKGATPSNTTAKGVSFANPVASIVSPAKGCPLEQFLAKHHGVRRATPAAYVTAHKGVINRQVEGTHAALEMAHGPLSDELSEFVKMEARWAYSAEAADLLMRRPNDRNSTYLRVEEGRAPCTAFDSAFTQEASSKPVPVGERHPRILAAERRGTLSTQLRAYYEHLPPKVNVPLAGTPCARAREGEGDNGEGNDGREGRNDDSSSDGNSTGSSNRLGDGLIDGGSAARPSIDDEDEDTFHSRPSVKIPVPDHVKALLVDDWENVTKNQQLVPLPHAHPVEEILNDYLAYERPHRVEGSAAMDILEETIAGLREYFDKCLGRILLYRFERPQYHSMHELWNQPDSKHKSAVDTYGAEHLARLLVSLPELIAQTNMDQQSVNRLREELVKFTNWFSRHVTAYFVSEYETPGSDYTDKARGA